MIKPIDEIPENQIQASKTNRQKIRDDIQEAIDKHIQAFEFVGDYNFKYLANYAREEAGRMNRAMFGQYIRSHREEYKDKYVSFYDVVEKDYPIKITTIKGETKDTRRVFCSLQMDGLEERYSELLDAYFSKREEQKAERERRRAYERRYDNA